MTTDPSVAVLPDPRVPGAPGGQWWPHQALTADWVDRHHASFDVVHVHFGFEHLKADELRAWLAALTRRCTPLVVTVHDIVNPHVREQSDYQALLGMLVSAADALFTLTAGAQREVRRRWGRDATVVPHPHIVDLDVIHDLPERTAGRKDTHIGVHLKSIRTNTDVDAVVSLAEHCAAASTPLTVFHHVDAEVPALATGTTIITHAPMSDDELHASLRTMTHAVLPYRFGTHSGWLEMCHDLGVTPVVPAHVGFYRKQQPCLTFSRGGATAGADSHPPQYTWPQWEPVPTTTPAVRAKDRQAQAYDVAQTHANTYRDLTARRADDCTDGQVSGP